MEQFRITFEDYIKLMFSDSKRNKRLAILGIVVTILMSIVGIITTPKPLPQKDLPPPPPPEIWIETRIGINDGAGDASAYVYEDTAERMGLKHGMKVALQNYNEANKVSIQLTVLIVPQTGKRTIGEFFISTKNVVALKLIKNKDCIGIGIYSVEYKEIF